MNMNIAPPPRAKELRRRARQQLKGHWVIAIIATVIAMMLGASVSGAPTVTFNSNDDQAEEDIDIKTVEELGNWLHDMVEEQTVIIPNSIDVTFESSEQMEIWVEEELVPIFDDLLIILRTYLVFFWPFLLIALIVALARALVSACMSVGLSRFRLDLHDGDEAKIETVFWGFGRVFFKALLVHLLRSIFVFLWSLLFVIPGIIAAYRYSMVDYIMAENPNMSVMDILRESKRMMKGNKWRLFCLQFSFIGWSILAELALGIGHLWLNPYIGQAEASFYHEVSGRAAIRASAEALGDLMEGF